MPQGGMGFATDPKVNDRSAATWCNEIFLIKFNIIYLIDIIVIKSILARNFPPISRLFPTCGGKFSRWLASIFIVR